MAVRSSMQTDLIPRIRLMIGDPSGTPQFSDQNIQDILDDYRETVRYELLHPDPDIQPAQGAGGTASFVWAAYESRFPFWEADEVLQGQVSGVSWTVLTPVSSERMVGRWTFAVTLPAIATPPAQLPPVFVVGKNYDIYLTAADLCDMWAATLARAYSFTADNRTFNRQQQAESLRAQACIYRQKGRPRMLQATRGDLTSAEETKRGSGWRGLGDMFSTWR